MISDFSLSKGKIPLSTLTTASKRTRTQFQVEQKQDISKKITPLESQIIFQTDKIPEEKPIKVQQTETFEYKEFKLKNERFKQYQVSASAIQDYIEEDEKFCDFSKLNTNHQRGIFFNFLIN